MHFNFLDAIALAGLAPSPFHIKAEAPRFVSPDFGFRQLGKQIANLRKYPGVGGRVGTGGSPNGRLVNVDDLVHMFQAFNGVVGQRY